MPFNTQGLTNEIKEIFEHRQPLKNKKKHRSKTVNKPHLAAVESAENASIAALELAIAKEGEKINSEVEQHFKESRESLEILNEKVLELTLQIEQEKRQAQEKTAMKAAEHHHLDESYKSLQNDVEQVNQSFKEIAEYEVQELATRNQRKTDILNDRLAEALRIKNDYHNPKKAARYGCFTSLWVKIVHHNLNSPMHTKKQRRSLQMSFIEEVAAAFQGQKLAKDGQSISPQELEVMLLSIAQKMNIGIHGKQDVQQHSLGLQAQAEKLLNHHEKQSLIRLTKGLILLGVLNCIERQIGSEHNSAPSRLLKQIQRLKAQVKTSLVALTDDRILDNQYLFEKTNRLSTETYDCFKADLDRSVYDTRNKTSLSL